MNFKIFSSETFQNPSVDTFNIPPFQLISQSTDLLLSIKFTILTFAINEQYSVLLLCFFFLRFIQFHWKGRFKKRGGRERDLPSTVHFPNGCIGRSWANPKPDLPHGCRVSRVWAVLHCFLCQPQNASSYDWSLSLTERWIHSGDREAWYSASIG